MSDDLDPLGRAMRETEAPLDNDRRARMRARVLNNVAAGPHAGWHIGAQRLLLVAAVLLVASVAVGGAASASLPGDPAFDLKLGAERLELALSTDLYRRLDRTLENADRRLDELETIARVDPRRLAIAADAYGRNLEELHSAVEAMATSQHPERVRALDEARVDLERHVARLTSLRRVIDSDVQRALDEARDTDERIREVEVQIDRGGDRGGPGAPTGRPALPTDSPVTSAPASAPARTLTPIVTAQPTRTGEPGRTPEPSPVPTGSTEPTKSPDPTKTPDPTATPQPTKTPSAPQSATPSPSPTPSSSTSGRGRG